MFSARVYSQGYGWSDSILLICVLYSGYYYRTEIQKAKDQMSRVFLNAQMISDNNTRNLSFICFISCIFSSIEEASFVGCDQNLMLSAFIRKITKLLGCLVDFKGIMWFAVSGCLDYNLEAITTIWWLSYFNDFSKELH